MSDRLDPALAIGDRLPALSRAISQDLMNAYTFTLGVGNPIHHDPEFARKTEFGGPIASGPIALALVDDALASAYPREWLRSGSIDVAFLKPVRPGDTVTTNLTLSDLAEEGGSRSLTFAVECRNQQDVVVLAGTARLRQHR